MSTQQQKVQHLFLRAGFGETPSRIAEIQKQTLSKIVDDVFSASQKNSPIDFINDPRNENQEEASNMQIAMMVVKSRKELRDLNVVWLYRMMSTNAVLREKMTFFWHNHFATSVPFGFLMQLQNNTLRTHSLGKFSDLLHSVAKDPAMLLYLNNQQNKKDSPNENFAREVMELFTLGIGHYTEKDVKEAARAFTGWTANKKGEFEFRERVHDDGQKEFLGKKGGFSGDDIIRILLEQKQTAIYVTTKIYREFVNYKIDEARVQALAEGFYNSGYDISKLMKNIFTSDWFYEEENIGCKIISPVELMVRYMRLFDVDFKNDKTMLAMQKVLGQTLFFPPNVAGWKGGRDWIDSSSLLLRLSLAQMFLKNGYVELKPKPEFEDQQADERDREKRFIVKSNMLPVQNYFSKIPHPDLVNKIMESFIQVPKFIPNQKIVNDLNGKTSSEIIIATLSLPEFQLV